MFEFMLSRFVADLGFRISNFVMIGLMILLIVPLAAAKLSEQQVQKAIKGKPAAEALSALKQMDQNDPWVLYYSAQNEPDAALVVEYYKKILQLAPQHQLAATALLETANYSYALGYYITAGKLYQELIEKYPRSPWCEKAYYWGAASCLATKQTAAARVLYEQYLGKYSSLNEWVQLGIGDSYFLEKEYQQALRAYQMLINSYPQSTLAVTAYNRISECYAILGRDDKAQEYLDIVKNKYPSSFYAVIKKDTVLYKPPAPVAVPESTAVDGAPAEVATAPAVPITATADGNFVVQVGSFTRQVTAQDVCKRLNDAGYPTEISAKIDNAKQYFRIWVGPFATKEQAKIVGQQLKTNEDLDYFILTK